MSLRPPPCDIFPTRSQLEAYARVWAGQNGYAVVVKSSDKNRVILKCDRGGSYRNRWNLSEETRQRITGTRLKD